MGYNKSPKSVTRVNGYLDILASSNGQVVTFKSSSPKTLAYAIHEGLYAAEHLRWPKLSHLRKTYEVFSNPTSVVCKPKMAQVLQEGSLILDDITDWISALSVILKYKDSTLPIILPNLNLESDSDREMLEGWCSNNNYQIFILPLGLKVIKIT